MSDETTAWLADIGQRGAALIAGVLEDDELAWQLVRDEDPRDLLVHTLLVLREVADESGTRRRLTHFARLKAARLADLHDSL